MHQRIDKHRRCRPAAVVVLLVGTTFAHFVLLSEATAAPPSFAGIGRLTAPLFSGAESNAPVAQQPAQQSPEPPPFADPANGVVVSILGGSVFSGASAFQTGAAFAYFFGPKAAVGFEAEGDFTFGPGGRVIQGMGSFVVQAGARTSKFVPYFAIGGGYLRATSKFPDATQAVLDDFGIVTEPKTQTGPFFQLGGGVRFYMKPGLSFRADIRFFRTPLDLEVDTGFFDGLYAMRRIAGMVSFDF